MLHSAGAGSPALPTVVLVHGQGVSYRYLAPLAGPAVRRRPGGGPRPARLRALPLRRGRPGPAGPVDGAGRLAAGDRARGGRRRRPLDRLPGGRRRRGAQPGGARPGGAGRRHRRRPGAQLAPPGGAAARGPGPAAARTCCPWSSATTAAAARAATSAPSTTCSPTASRTRSRSLPVPPVLVRGRWDAVSPRAWNLELVARAPGSRLVEVPGRRAQHRLDPRGRVRAGRAGGRGRRRGRRGRGPVQRLACRRGRRAVADPDRARHQGLDLGPRARLPRVRPRRGRRAAGRDRAPAARERRRLAAGARARRRPRAARSPRRGRRWSTAATSGTSSSCSASG